MDKYVELTTETIVDYVNSKTDFFASDAVYECEEIGDGNLNLVFRVKDTKNNTSVIIKQALPYVRVSGGDWPMDINRGAIETAVLELHYELTDGLVPKVYSFDRDMYCVIMEDLYDYTIMRTGLLEYNSYPKFADQITDYLVKTLLLTSDVVMDHKDKKELVKKYINPELCEITEQLVYTEPFRIGGRNDMEDFLVDFQKTELAEDEELSLEVAKLKFDFMNNAQALLHGDVHTGSIFVNQENTRVIDPEFAFYGPMAYDVGALVANLIMNYISTLAWLPEGEKRQNHLDYLLTATKDVVDLFAEKFLKLWDEVVTDEMAKTPGFKEWYLEDVLVNTAGVAGCEMIRRSVGFAHVKDLDSIPDDTLREKALKTNILLAKHLIKNRHEFTTGAAYQKVVKEITLD
ncbi:MAG: S-methyl-5-thioribose kinase [Firmicutes bacterium]|nr:S-methyl-5-thioribose kinase [Bacillota bacterium]